MCGRTCSSGGCSWYREMFATREGTVRHFSFPLPCRPGTLHPVSSSPIALDIDNRASTTNYYPSPQVAFNSQQYLSSRRTSLLLKYSNSIIKIQHLYGNIKFSSLWQPSKRNAHPSTHVAVAVVDITPSPDIRMVFRESHSRHLQQVEPHAATGLYLGCPRTLDTPVSIRIQPTTEIQIPKSAAVSWAGTLWMHFLVSHVEGQSSGRRTRTYTSLF